MKKFLLPLSIAIVCTLAACRHRGDTLSHASARKAAERYMKMLIDGRYEDYISGMVDGDSLPADMRSQMVDLLAQFCQGQSLNKSMLAVSATADSIQDSTAYVYLDVTYGDSTTEQVGMQLVYIGERWFMQ